ncbi:helix-turn-helix domain-containing protein [Nonomuraea sp. NBC_01738]|uniref:helix-turn-helix domain-containing protein n=1 Tax=Nonomuraea sp. NBC_01738 TaxID=2976003 RepID=UPI002E15FC78|nr:helix-turn-helix domain-containing protein [Nonomuraea sp. NBC_01738]
MRSLVQVIGLQAFHVTAGPMHRSHIHPELEFNLVLSGTATYATIDGTVDLPPGRLAVFWGGYPHRLLTAEGVDFLWATVPLSAVIGHEPLSAAVERMLTGEFLYGTADEADPDRFLMHRWNRELSHEPAPKVAEICLLEMHARLARLGGGQPAATGAGAAQARSAERILAVVARRYTERLTVEEIAAAASVHPTYAALAFKQALGMSVWQYVTRLRVAHACRLLLVTDWGIDRVAHASGFQTRSSFYRAFTGSVRQTPTDYRRDGLPADEFRVAEAGP